MASSPQTASSFPKSSFLTSMSSKTASKRNGMPFRVPTSVEKRMRPRASFICSCVIFSLLASRSRLFVMAFRARSQTASLTSPTWTSKPDWAATWAIPAPMLPAPTTPTFPISSIFIAHPPWGRYFCGLPDLENDGGRRVAGGAAGEEQVAPSLHRQLLDPLDDEPGAGGPLGVAEDEGGTVIVHAVHVQPHGLGHDHVVGGEGVVRLDDAQVRGLDAGVVEGRFRGRGYGGRHEGVVRGGEAEGDDPDFDVRVGGELRRLVAGGDGDSAVSVGGIGLGPEGVHPFGDDGLQGRQPLPRAGGHPLVGIDGDRFLPGDLDLDREHVALLELAVLGQGILVLLLPPEGDGVAFLPGYAVFLADFLRGLDH